MRLEMHTGIVLRRSDTYREDGSLEVAMQSEDNVVDVDAANIIYAEPLHLSSADTVSPVMGQKVFIIGFEDSANEDDRYFWVGVETNVQFPDLSYDTISRVMADEDGNRIIFGLGKIQIDQVGEDFVDEKRKIGEGTDFETESDSRITNRHINRITMTPGSIKTMQIKRTSTKEEDDEKVSQKYEEYVLQQYSMYYDITNDKEGFRSELTMEQANGNFLMMVNEKEKESLNIQIAGDGGEKSGAVKIKMHKGKEQISSTLSSGGDGKFLSSVLDMAKGKETIATIDTVNGNELVMNKKGVTLTIKEDLNIITEGDTNIETKGDTSVKTEGKTDITSTKDITVETKGNLDITSSKNVTLKGVNVKLTGGIAEVGGTVAPTGSGALCGIPACLFTGAPHVGNKSNGT